MFRDNERNIFIPAVRPCGERDLSIIQRQLDEFIAGGEGLKAKPGTVILALPETLKGLNLTLLFAPESGQQIGFGQAQLEPSVEEEDQAFRGYWTAFVVGSQFEGFGFGSLLRQHMKGLVVQRNPDRHIVLYSTIAATGRHRKAARRILESSGATPHPNYPDVYEETLFHPREKLRSLKSQPEEITLNEVELIKPGRQLMREDGKISVRGRLGFRKRQTLIVGGKKIATVGLQLRLGVWRTVVRFRNEEFSYDDIGKVMIFLRNQGFKIRMRK